MNWQERLRVCATWVFSLLFFPLLALISAYFDLLLGPFLLGYLALTRMGSAITWGLVFLEGFVEKPKTDESKFPFSYANPWQLLLFPARTNDSEFKEALDIFHRAGLKIWEAKLAAFFCAFFYTGDFLDGFDDDWGRPIRFQGIKAQSIVHIGWDLTNALIFLCFDHSWLAWFFAIVVAIEVLGLCYFHYLEEVRFKSLPFFADFYQEPASDRWKNK